MTHVFGLYKKLSVIDDPKTYLFIDEPSPTENTIMRRIFVREDNKFEL